LLADLYMPDASDGFTVVNAMRHTQPNAVTLVLSNYPVLQAAMTAILLQADQILVKPIGFAEIVAIIQNKLSNPSAHPEVPKERVAAILERDMQTTIQNWMARVEHSRSRTRTELAISLFSSATSFVVCVYHPMPNPLFPTPRANMESSAASKATLSPWSWKNRGSFRSASSILCKTIWAESTSAPCCST
jgi:hypothetical protein